MSPSARRPFDWSAPRGDGGIAEVGIPWAETCYRDWHRTSWTVVGFYWTPPSDHHLCHLNLLTTKTPCWPRRVCSQETEAEENQFAEGIGLGRHHLDQSLGRFPYSTVPPREKVICCQRLRVPQPGRSRPGESPPGCRSSLATGVTSACTPSHRPRSAHLEPVFCGLLACWIRATLVLHQVEAAEDRMVLEVEERIEGRPGVEGRWAGEMRLYLDWPS